MSEASEQDSVSPAALEAEPLVPPRAPDDRRFYLWVAIATALHAMLFTGFASTASRQVGDPRGATADAVSVSFVSEADLKGHATVPEEAAGAPTPPPTPATAPAPSEPSPPAPPTPPQTDAAAPPPPPVTTPVASEQLTLKSDEPAIEQAKSSRETPPSEPKQTEDTKAEVDPAAKPEPAKPEQTRQKQVKSPPTRTALLDLSLPPATFASPAGRGGAGVQRPAGITRSGENDAFAVGVIAALQRTMPQLRETYGRVTVRIKLDMNGNLVSTEVIKPSKVAGLDQNVVFATRQSSFPFPPRSSKPADLIFVVTYIYR